MPSVAIGPGPPRRWVAMAILLVAVVALGALVVGASPPLVEQPAEFSHRLHSGEVGIDCQFCHAYARRSTVAGLPSLQTCRGCHLQVKPESELVAPIFEAWERQDPIAWLQVHDLPEYVRFDHSAHVGAGVDCATCHGDVRAMETAQRAVDHTMGFCVDCHSRNEAPLDCLTCHY